MPDVEHRIEATPRETMFLVCLSQAYELAGRKVSDSTIVSAAKEMASRIPCSDKEIRELFAIARDNSDIPTIKTLWKAWDIMNENRVPEPSSTLAYDKSPSLIRKINFMTTLKLLAFKTGRYAEMCNAYVTEKVCGKYRYKNPGLKHKFDSEMIPLMERICGNRLGDNPNLPDHPIRRWNG